MQPLATCMHYLQIEKMAIGLQISEPWLREYQVLYFDTWALCVINICSLSLWLVSLVKQRHVLSTLICLEICDSGAMKP